jgi:hypothetical protein
MNDNGFVLVNNNLICKPSPYEDDEAIFMSSIFFHADIAVER